MYVVTVTFILAADHVETFMPLMVENARQSLEVEPGCHRFDVCQDPVRPSVVFLYELYDDREAFDLHLGMEHFQKFSAATEDMVVSKDVNTYTLVAS